MEIAGSLLGQKAETFTDQEKSFIHQVAVRLRMRETERQFERQDMGLYVRVAASLWDLAGMAAAMPTKHPPKTRDDWLRIITGINFNFVSSAEPGLSREVIDV